jgi:hypothetical protein
MRSLAVLLCLLVFPFALRAEEDDRPWREQPFLGLSVRDTDRGLVVGWVSPGPLGGRGFESSSGIQRGDNLVSVDGRAVDADGFKAAVKAKQPGDDVRLVVRRSPEARADAAIPQGGVGGEERTIEVTLGARSDWAGTVGRGLGGRVLPEPEEGAYESLVLEAAAEAGVRAGREGVGGGLDALLPYLARIQEDALDPGSLPAVVNAFRRPLSVDAVEARIAKAVTAAAEGDLALVESLVLQVLDLESPDVVIREVMEQEPAELEAAEIGSLLRFARQHLESYQRAKPWRRQAEDLVRTLRTSVSIYDESADQHVRTLNRDVGPRVDGLLQLALVLLRFAPARWEVEAQERHADFLTDTMGSGGAGIELPEEVRALVEGDVLWYDKDELGRYRVLGGPGPNRYAMHHVAAVYDLGGDDRYDYAASPTPDAAPIALRLVVDLAGDDVHESTADFEGPATGVFGLSLLDDRAGDDVYRSRRSFSIGAGLVGLGILLDHAGHDVYENLGEDSGWAIGVGFWGAGLVIDRAGADVYHGEKHVQGVGGPRGLGAIIDAQGRDLYRANGPSFASAYDTPAVYLGMSQGFGIGVRGYAAGGVGALYDLAGHDRYEAGEFSQAGGYYFGLGILHDVAGDDLYHGNRYGQAFAAHQAVGVLVDDAGDDTYWSMTAASQAGTWDQSIGLLLDKAGNDAYRCDGLGQGGASMQALALLIDLGGNDRYTGHGGSVQGQGGGNGYHYDADRVFSFSGLFDLGGGHDTYSAPDRTNDALRPTGAWNEAKPADSSLYGVFVDR